MSDEYRVVSADSHFVEPADVFTSRVEAQLRDRVPRTEFGALIPGQEGEFWVVPASSAVEPRAVSTFFSAGRTTQEAREANRSGFARAPQVVFDPALPL